MGINSLHKILDMTPDMTPWESFLALLVPSFLSLILFLNPLSVSVSLWFKFPILLFLDSYPHILFLSLLSASVSLWF